MRKYISILTIALTSIFALYLSACGDYSTTSGKGAYLAVPNTSNSNDNNNAQNNDNNNNNDVQNDDITILLSKISPDEGPEGITVTITGENFTKDTVSSVLICDQKADDIKIKSDTEITCRIPDLGDKDKICDVEVKASKSSDILKNSFKYKKLPLDDPDPCLKYPWKCDNDGIDREPSYDRDGWYQN